MANKKKHNPDKDADPKSETLDSGDQVQEAPKDDAPSEPDIKTEPPVADEGTLKDAAPETEPSENSEQSDDPADDPIAEDAPTEMPPETQPEPQVQRVIEKRGGFAPALIGGILAAGLGFAAARTEILDPYLPQSWQAGNTGEAIAVLQASVNDHAAALATLQTDLGAVVIPDLAPLQAQLDAIEAKIAPLKAETAAIGTRFIDLDARLTPLDSRLSDVEKRPLTDNVSQTAIAAYERELAALQQSMVTQRGEVEALIENARAIKAQAFAIEETAAETAQLASNRATVARLRGALDDGSAIAPMLAELAAASVPVPDGLTGLADEGVVTHAALADAFAPAARAALSAERAQGDSGGLGGFLQRHLGARSIEPREGDDPDAILSRAEAALTNGQLPQALTEIAALPDVARAEMAGWVTLATTRVTALTAADALAQSLNTN